MPTVSLRAALVAPAVALLFASAPLAQTPEPPMIRPVSTDGSLWFSFPLFTVGEVVNGYQPPGIPDGMGAWELNDRTLRFFVNHELTATSGYRYGIDNGRLLLTGARVSYFDVDRRTLQIIHAEEAYDQVIDRFGDRVTRAQQINEGSSPTAGFDRFCSANFFERGAFGLVNDLFFTGEETGNGQLYVLDPHTQRMYAVPAFGRAAFEAVTLIDTGDPSTVAALIGDDRQGAPLYLYVGRKEASGGLLEKNGLANGKLYVWVADDGSLSPEDWNGTGTVRSGTFVRVMQYDPAMAGTDGYDAAGYADMATLDAMSAAVGAFQFSRPEDVATNPANGTQVAFASTGRSSAYPSDSWGTTYVVDVDFGASDITANLRIVYDGDDAGNGQFSHPDEGLRSPDNLEWAQDGMIYVQEDRSVGGFGAVSAMEASVWSVDPTTGELERIGMMDRSAVPSGQTDGNPGDIGNWESSGIVDVSEMFGLPAPIKLLMLNVQAHSIRDGVIAGNALVEGGQLLFMLGIDGFGPLAATLEAEQPTTLIQALALIGSQPVANEEASVEAFGLEAAFPNPFAQQTVIRYSTPEATPLTITAYDALGRVVATLVDASVPAGTHEVTFDASDLPTGIYMLRMTSSEGTDLLRVTVAR